MKLLLKARSDNEHYSADCDFAVLDLTPDLARLALRRIEAARRIRLDDTALHAVSYWGYYVEWVSWEDAGEFAEILDEGCLPIPHDFQYEPQRNECARMLVYPSIDLNNNKDTIAFRTIPKHCDFYITTDEIDRELLHFVASQRF
jgi:hypothetical protein